MTDVRQNLIDFLNSPQAEAISLREVSLRLGRNGSYLQQYLYGKKSPRKLAHEDRLALHAMLGIPIEQLGLGPDAARSRPATRPPSDDDDVEPYTPTRMPGVPVQARSGASYRVRRDVVGRHPLGILVGDVLTFDTAPAAIEGVRSEQLVLVEVARGEEAPRLWLREFLRPAIVVTNRTTDNLAMALDDPALPHVARIVGILRSLHRDT